MRNLDEALRETERWQRHGGSDTYNWPWWKWLLALLLHPLSWGTPYRSSVRTSPLVRYLQAQGHGARLGRLIREGGGVLEVEGRRIRIITSRTSKHERGDP